MLHINSITIKNFRPYYGTHIFDFGDQKGLTIICGSNGIGKTSLVKAIKFLLYDLLDSADFKLKNEINVIAWEEEDYDMYVAMDFNYNGNNYVLKRIKTRKYDVKEPQSDADFTDILTLIINNNNVVEKEEIKRVLKYIIPKEISEYILFEGETISKYKDLLDNNKNHEIYRSIRRILGIAILEKSESDLKKHLDVLINKQNKLVKENIKNKKLYSELESLNEQLKNFENEKEKIKNDYENNTEKIKEYDKILGNNQRTKKLIEEKYKFETKLDLKSEELKELKIKLKNYLKNYKLICIDFVKKSITEVPEKIKKINIYKEENKKINQNIKIFSGLLNLSQCTFCNNHIDENSHIIIQKNIEDFKQKLVNIDKNDEEIVKKYEVKSYVFTNILKEIKETNFKEDILELEKKIDETTIEREKIKDEGYNINKQLESWEGSSDLQEIIKNRDLCFKNQEKYKNILETNDKKIKQIKNDISGITLTYSEEVDLTIINNKITKTKDLIAIFNKTIEEYSNKMRLRVQEHASLMFKNISEEKAYDKIEVDEKYGLKLKDNKKRVVLNISSGIMTLIAMSLIYGLHKNSSLTGTIILDSPFSTLEDTYRDRIIESFQKLSPQVILLSYKDKINIDSIRNSMKNSLINEYEIFRDKNLNDYIYKTQIRKEIK